MELQGTPYLFLILGLYLGCSIPIFNRVYDTAQIVIDEMFHIPQARAYCDGLYNVWDPKITTLPGLYLAVKIINLFVECNTYNLRMFNLIVSTVNMGLFYILLSYIYGLCCSRFNITLQAVNLAILPPLYFFSHVFYTDILSLTFLLLFTISAIKKYNFSIIMFGICSIVTRQTNVVWILMISGQKILEIIIKSSRVRANIYLTYHSKEYKGSDRKLAQAYLKRCYNWDDLCVAAKFHMRSKYHYLIPNKNSLSEFINMWSTVVPVFIFAVFVAHNGSIVVGDKKAHTMTLNFPQILYFILFYGFFGMPIVLSRFKSTLRFMVTNKMLVLCMVFVSLVVVRYNTVVHPYLLADNRHYTFYIWNRWYGKYSEAAYVTIPVYIFLACSFIDNLIHQNCLSFYTVYFLVLIPGLCFQKLLELRYFLIPYIIARLRFPKCPTWVVVLEFLWYVVINAAFFSVFFTKEIKWDDFEETQRIIW